MGSDPCEVHGQGVSQHCPHCCGVGMLFPSTLVGVLSLVHAGGAGRKLQRGRWLKGRRRRWWNITCSLLWKSKGEGGVVEVAAGSA